MLVGVHRVDKLYHKGRRGLGFGHAGSNHRLELAIRLKPVRAGQASAPGVTPASRSLRGGAPIGLPNSPHRLGRIVHFRDEADAARWLGNPAIDFLGGLERNWSNISARV
jgi:hypothetical protein